VRAPLGQQLEAAERQVEQLPVLVVRLLAVEARARHHLAVAVARQLRDEADVVLADLHHLLAQVVLRGDAALGAGPPGRGGGARRGEETNISVWGLWAGFRISNQFKSLQIMYTHVAKACKKFNKATKK